MQVKDYVKKLDELDSKVATLNTDSSRKLDVEDLKKHIQTSLVTTRPSNFTPFSD
jgi:hypothetical protein